jgi:hypothetical protein
VWEAGNSNLTRIQRFLPADYYLLIILPLVASLLIILPVVASMHANRRFSPSSLFHSEALVICVVAYQGVAPLLGILFLLWQCMGLQSLQDLCCHTACPSPVVLHGMQVVSTRFTKSVIASRAALTYKQAQERIDNKELNDEVTLGEGTATGVANLTCDNSK